MAAEVLLAPFAEALHRFCKREGVEEIISHPRAEGDMPAAPEIPKGNAEVRLPEIQIQLDAEKCGNAADNIDAA